MPHTGVPAPTTSRRLCAAAAGLALIGGLACGCGSTPAPSGDAATSGSPPRAQPSMSGGYAVGPDGKLVKPSDAPTPTLPATPTTLTQNTPAAAEDFARYFVAVTEYAWNTGDTTTLREISTDDCILCDGMAHNIETRYGSGGWNQNLRYEITEVNSPLPYPGVPDKHVSILHVRTSVEARYDGYKLERVQPRDELIELHSCFMQSWTACGGVGADDPQSD